ncbi:MAG: hypothetical protein ACI837_000051 [Crocinitomicaceae bacterium]|jgi:hypothetical protein
MKFLLYIALFIPSMAFSQGAMGMLFEELASDSIVAPSVKIHTSIKPTIRQVSDRGNFTLLTLLADLNYAQTTESNFKVGLGTEFSALFNDKWFIRLAAVQGISNLDSLYEPKSYVLAPQKDFDAYTDLRGRVSYTPNHIFNFQVGLDHNFIGEGSRSLFLSDYGKPYPFALIRANFWRFEYSIMYQFLKERDQNKWEGKFASSHHISFNATPWLNIGIFESVIFQPKDTLLQRGFDVEYLNPFVFYRPQEYSLGSSDNVLLGVEISAVIEKNHTIYSQLILDEFYLSELRAKTGWWANKFGAQIGAKGRFSIGKNKFFYRAEYNFVRPYTYSHISEELNYGNQGYNLAHPYGSNFMEALGELKWSMNKWSAKFFMNYALKGEAQNGYNYGGDVYDSYVNRPYEYGHFIGQGHQVNKMNFGLTGAYQISKYGKINVFVENYLRFNTDMNAPSYVLVAGIRSMLWNDHRNY